MMVTYFYFGQFTLSNYLVTEHANYCRHQTYSCNQYCLGCNYPPELRQACSWIIQQPMSTIIYSLPCFAQDSRIHCSCVACKNPRYKRTMQLGLRVLEISSRTDNCATAVQCRSNHNNRLHAILNCTGSKFDYNNGFDIVIGVAVRQWPIDLDGCSHSRNLPLHILKEFIVVAANIRAFRIPIAFSDVQLPTGEAECMIIIIVIIYYYYV